MKWPDEVRSPESLAPREVEVGEDEIAQALQLADRMTIEDLSGFRDEYRQALEGIITAKAEGNPLPAPAEDGEQDKGEVVDLVAALNASVKAAKESRGEHGEDATVHKMRPSKKTALGHVPQRPHSHPGGAHPRLPTAPAVRSRHGAQSPGPAAIDRTNLDHERPGRSVEFGGGAACRHRCAGDRVQGGMRSPYGRPSHVARTGRPLPHRQRAQVTRTRST
ncbi:hypothetical protein ACWGBN_24560 [Streptomyces anulatus]